jgi:hypothetical protein
MAEFYVAYLVDGKRCIGIVDAPVILQALRFASYDEFQRAMDSLRETWTLRAEIEEPREYTSSPEATDAWLRKLASAAELEPEKKLPRDLLPQRVPLVV